MSTDLKTSAKPNRPRRFAGARGSATGELAHKAFWQTDVDCAVNLVLRLADCWEGDFVGEVRRKLKAWDNTKSPNDPSSATASTARPERK